MRGRSYVPRERLYMRPEGVEGTMSLEQQKALDFVADFYRRTAGGGPTAAQVAGHLGTDEESALALLLDLCRQGALLPPRFWLKDRPMPRGDKP